MIDLLEAAPTEHIEMVIHQHLPMFHTEHCVYCTFLSEGTDFTNCGRPCEKHRVSLRDRIGMLHPVRVDIGCRNTVYNAIEQSGAEYIPHFYPLVFARIVSSFGRVSEKSRRSHHIISRSARRQTERNKRMVHVKSH